jgi:hypothetical protein
LARHNNRVTVCLESIVNIVYVGGRPIQEQVFELSSLIGNYSSYEIACGSVEV